MLKPEISDMKFYGEFKISVNQETEKYELYNSVEAERRLYEITTNYIELLSSFGINKNEIKIEDNLFCSFINKYSPKEIYLLMWFPESIFNYGFRYKLAKTNRDKNPSLTDAKFIILLGHGNTIEEVEKTQFKTNIFIDKDCCFFLERKIIIDPKILAIKAGTSSGQNFSILFGYKRDYKNVSEYMENIIKTNLKKYQ